MNRFQNFTHKELEILEDALSRFEPSEHCHPDEAGKCRDALMAEFHDQRRAANTDSGSHFGIPRTPRYSRFIAE